MFNLYKYNIKLRHLLIYAIFKNKSFYLYIKGTYIQRHCDVNLFPKRKFI